MCSLISAAPAVEGKKREEEKKLAAVRQASDAVWSRLGFVPKASATSSSAEGVDGGRLVVGGVREFEMREREAEGGTLRLLPPGPRALRCEDAVRAPPRQNVSLFFAVCPLIAPCWRVLPAD